MSHTTGADRKTYCAGAEDAVRLHSLALTSRQTRRADAKERYLSVFDVLI